MPRAITKFNTQRQHIHTQMLIRSQFGKEVLFNAILDTGAPYTELSDRSLARIGYKLIESDIQTRDLQETQKYSRLRLPVVLTLGQELRDWVVFVSRFHESWAVDALIGLDFFRQFRVSIDYSVRYLDD